MIEIDSGVVLAMLVPYPNKIAAAHGAKIPVYWRGPQGPGKWAKEHNIAARFASEELARAWLDATAGDSHPGRRDVEFWSEPTTETDRCFDDHVITDPPPGADVPAPRPQPVQETLLPATPVG